MSCELLFPGNSFAEKFADLLANAEMKALIKPEVIWNASIASTLGLAAKTGEAEDSLKKQFAQVQELFKSIDVLCVPATLDAAFDADVRYPTEQLGRTFSNYLSWIPGSIAELVVNLVQLALQVFVDRLSTTHVELLVPRMMPACIVTTFLCPALVLPCGFLEAGELQTGLGLGVSRACNASEHRAVGPSLEDGRPVGLQLVAAFGEDAALLRAAAALEKQLKLPQGCPEPRCGTAELGTKGPKTVEEAAVHHGLR